MLTPFRPSFPSSRRTIWPPRRAALVALCLMVAACPPPPPDEVQDRAAAAALSAGGAAAKRPWPATPARRPVELYVDLSQSMRGFLDASFSTEPIRYRAVIDMLDVELQPGPIYGFGSTIREAGHGARQTLDNQAIYGDGNTQMEDVFPRIAADSQLTTSHLVIGDGRRADPLLANAQYVGMRRLAMEWIDRGGTFAVAASRAPFTTVAADPSGCRPAEESGDAGKCPLYAFAFIAPGDEARVSAALAERFEHLFVAPAPPADERAVVFREVKPSSAIGLEPLWVPRDGGGTVARARGRDFTNDPLEAELVPTDTETQVGRVRAAVFAGEGLRAELYARPLHDDGGPGWLLVTGTNQLMVPAASPLRWRIISQGDDADRVAYRIDLVPSGVPAWLADFDAPAAGDPVYTYGLGRLFQGFHGAAGAPVLRAYLVAN